jgi:hypothetical protein
MYICVDEHVYEYVMLLLYTKISILLSWLLCIYDWASSVWSIIRPFLLWLYWLLTIIIIMIIIYIYNSMIDSNDKQLILYYN